MLRGFVEPLLAKGMDALVLGCTHYPFVLPLLEKICGPSVRVIDPAPAVARQVERMLAAAEPPRAPSVDRGFIRYFTTGEPRTFGALLERLGGPSGDGDVSALVWRDGELADEPRSTGSAG